MALLDQFEAATQRSRQQASSQASGFFEMEGWKTFYYLLLFFKILNESNGVPMIIEPSTEASMIDLSSTNSPNPEGNEEGKTLKKKLHVRFLSLEFINPLIF